MTQLGLPYQPHSPTSRAAAGRAKESAGTQRARVLAYIQWCSATGATDEELQDRLGMNPSTQRPRRVELVAKGLVKDSGVRRQTRSGRAAVVWVAVS